MDEQKPQETKPESEVPKTEVKPEAGKAELANPHYAGGWIRLLAFIIDAIILGIVAQILGLVGLGSGSGGFELSTDIASVSNVVSILYLVGFIGWKQATPGMMILKLKVIKEENENKMNWWLVALLREIVGRFVCGITLGIGYLIIFWTKKKRGLHDMIGRTYVIREK